MAAGRTLIVVVRAFMAGVRADWWGMGHQVLGLIGGGNPEWSVECQV